MVDKILMKNKNIKWWSLFILWVLFCGLTGLMVPVMAQVITNSPPAGNGVLDSLPRGKDAIWLALVPPATFTITWLVGKIPPLPKEILPWLTPLTGILIGAVIDWGTKSNLPYWSTAGAGAISVAIFEAIKGLTKSGPESALTPTPKPDNTPKIQTPVT